MFGKIKQYIYDKTNFGRTRYLNYLYQYDLKQYFDNSLMGIEEEKKLATQIRLLAHAIEKGFSLSEPKPGFGKIKIIELIDLYEKYKLYQNPEDDQIQDIVFATLNAYVQFQNSNNVDVSFIPEVYQQNSKNTIESGISYYKLLENNNFADIAHARHSSRCFSMEKISEDTIKEVIKLAQTAPSACNRQATRIYACINSCKIDEIMKMHGGLNGFDKPSVIFAITGDLNLYQNEFERNTVYVDGGIFVMNLLYSLSAFNILSCPIIWGSEPDMDGKLERLLEIPHSHKIVALVVAGYSKEKEYKAAISAKREVERILYYVR